MTRRVNALALTLAIAVALGAAGCSQKVTGTFLPNQRPTVRLTWAPIRPPLSDSTVANFYIYQMNWVGYDVDGRVVAFEYAVDPPAVGDTLWQRTTKNEDLIYFRASRSDQVNSDNNKGHSESRDFHVFVVRSVDDRGAVSEPLARAFYSWGVAPEVWILTPKPDKNIHPQVTPAFKVSWTGVDYTDEYGSITEKPVKYKYHLFKLTDLKTSWIQYGDSLRANVAPDFAGWDSCGGDTTSVQFTNQTPRTEYMFVIVAIGRSGAYSPIFTPYNNMLQMYVNLAGKLGPRITIYNSFFYYQYPNGGYPNPLDPSWAVQLQVPADRPLTFNWFADPPAGSEMKRYRWVLDLTNLDDETPRTSQNDWYHWSSWSNQLSATVGPFTGVVPGHPDEVEEHNFYIEAEDINGLVSLGWVWFQVIKPTFANPLLIVNDTRLAVDQFYTNNTVRPPVLTDSIVKPPGEWPSAAELDTFLFAVGGVRWRMTPQPQPNSRPGVFQGYPFDTLGTRQGREIPTIPLATLGKYRHIVWINDQPSEEYKNVLGTQPMPTLKYMSQANKQNTLATWVQQGGQLWGLGGGFGHATNISWDIQGNNLNGQVYSNIGAPATLDLKAGRFMYDIMHWRSEFTVLPKVTMPNKALSRVDQVDPLALSVYPRPATYWLGEALTGQRSIYTKLPTYLSMKTTADPPWPTRTAYPQALNVEFLSEDNWIVETTGDPPVDYQALDTLYLVFATATAMRNDRLPGHASDVNPIMTFYHGPTLGDGGADNPQVVFTGLPIWNLREQDCRSLVQFVLEDLWGFAHPLAGLASAHPTAPTRSAAVRGPTVPLRSPVVPQGNAVRQPWPASNRLRVR